MNELEGKSGTRGNFNDIGKQHGVTYLDQG